MTRLVPFNPFVDEPAALVPRRWSEMMDRVFGPTLFETAEPFAWVPKSEVKELPDTYLFTLEAPGMKEGEIEVSLVGDTLKITGERLQEEKREGETWHINERSYGKFSRVFRIPAPVDADTVDAAMKDGILTVNVKKTNAGKVKKVKVHRA